MSTAANHPTEPEGMQPWLRFLFSLLFFGPAGYFAYERDFVLAGICLITGLSAFGGYRMGLICVLTWVIAIGAAIRFAPAIGQQYELHFQQWFGTTGLLNRFVSIGIVGVLISFAVSTVLILLTGRLLKKRQALNHVNRWLGFSIGAVEGLLVCLFFLGGMLIIEPIEQQRAPARQPNGPGSLVSRVILVSAEQTRASRIGSLIASSNPFVRFPQLNKLQDVQRTTAVLSDPAKIEGLLQHPSIKGLQQRPEFRAAITKLHADPKVQNILQSGRPMDREMAISLLNHPAVLELVDQPGFLEEAAKVVRNVMP